MMSVAGEMGYPTALSAPTWGFYASSFRGNEFRFQRPYGAYVMQNVLFKVSFPAEFHAQTAVECAMKLHEQVKGRLDEIDRIELTTHESAIRIISKVGANTRAARSGLEAGDRIALVNNVQIRDLQDLRSALANPPKTLNLGLQRGRQTGYLLMK